MTVESLEPLIEKSFFASMPSRQADRAGILSAWVGSLLVMLVTMCTALPLGVAAGVYLEEYARKNWLTALIEINIANLAGVPSIIWGLMALGLIYGVPQDLLGQLWDAIHSRVWIFSHVMDAVAWVFSSIGWLIGKVFSYRPFSYLAQVFSGVQIGRNVLTAGLTLGLLVLPIVIIATREAIRAVPARHPRRVDRAGRDEVADGAAPRAALLDRRDPDRHRSSACRARSARRPR